MQAEVTGHQAFVEGAEGAVVFGEGLYRSQPLHVDHLSPTQEVADPLFQPVRLLLQATVARQLLKQLEITDSRGGEGSTRSTWQTEQNFTLVH